MSAPASSLLATPSLLQIEARFRGRIWQGDVLGSSPDQVISSGFDELDKALPGGGWPTRNLTELLLPAEGLGEIRLLSESLKQIIQRGKNILLVSPPHIPYMHAWENLHMDSRHILIARVYKPAERLWVLEQGVKSSAFGAVIGWLPAASQQTTRRLQIIARTAASLVFLFRPVSAQFEPSAAPLRILLGSARRHVLSVRILKRRGIPVASPIRISLPWTGRFSNSVASLSASAQYNAVDRSSLSNVVT